MASVPEKYEVRLHDNTMACMPTKLTTWMYAMCKEKSLTCMPDNTFNNSTQRNPWPACQTILLTILHSEIHGLHARQYFQQFLYTNCPLGDDYTHNVHKESCKLINNNHSVLSVKGNTFSTDKVYTLPSELHYFKYSKVCAMGMWISSLPHHPSNPRAKPP